MSALRLENLCKRFGDTEVVKNVSLTLEGNNLCVFLGPSGCGKTTTLRMIAGLEAATSGRIHIGDRDVTALEPKDRDIAMVFQNYALYPQKTVVQNLAFGLRMRNVPQAEIDRRVSEASSLLGLSELLQRKPKQLSGGQMQRVALGRALVRDAQMFLLDEPLSNLDAKLRVQMREEILKLHRRIRKPMIYVTHDQVEAMTLAERIVVMNAGRIEQVGTPLEIFDRPQSLFVAGFIGSPEMNLLDMSYKEGMLGFGDLAIRLPARLPIGENHHLKVGIRPDHLHVGEPQSSDAGHVPLEVDVVEQLGTTTLVIGQSQGQRVQAFGPRIDARLGERIPLTFSPINLHIFDAKSGARISAPWEGGQP
ncbi:MAG: glycerol-3-phosphate ABC transporter ATP-binding protein [Planctomycetes bacterium RBG_16_55_9]|nr:MAG: glycerol-3-phosphate ABC transporter ATP-binding protein [Planctomycetes bacterium RBG_16_55_9]